MTRMLEIRLGETVISGMYVCDTSTDAILNIESYHLPGFGQSTSYLSSEGKSPDGNAN